MLLCPCPTNDGVEERTAERGRNGAERAGGWFCVIRFSIIPPLLLYVSRLDLVDVFGSIVSPCRVARPAERASVYMCDSRIFIAFSCVDAERILHAESVRRRT